MSILALIHEVLGGIPLLLERNETGGYAVVTHDRELLDVLLREYSLLLMDDSPTVHHAIRPARSSDPMLDLEIATEFDDVLNQMLSDDVAAAYESLDDEVWTDEQLDVWLSICGKARRTFREVQMTKREQALATAVLEVTYHAVLSMLDEPMTYGEGDLPRAG